jgi:ParB-like chromosome segregation protein Spo0J
MKTEYPLLKKIKISEIKGADYNPRKITNEALGRLTKSLSELGDLSPITINARTGNTIIGGHQRLKIYKAMGKEFIEAWVVDLPLEKERAANLALNHLAGEFDIPALKDLLDQIDNSNLDIEVTGFSNAELSRLMSQTIPAGALELDQEASKAGDPAELTGDFTPPPSAIRLVPIYLTNDEHDEFMRKVNKIGESLKTDTCTDTIRSCVEKAYNEL